MKSVVDSRVTTAYAKNTEWTRMFVQENTKTRRTRVVFDIRAAQVEKPSNLVKHGDNECLGLFLCNFLPNFGYLLKV